MKNLKIILTTCLILATIVDIFFDNYFLETSADLSYWLQKEGEKPLTLISLVFTFPLAFGLLFCAYFWILNSRKQLKALYYFNVFLIPISIGVILKNVWYKGRPYAIREDVSGSSCDPGMPSGHSIMALSGYYVVYKVLVDDMYAGNQRIRRFSQTFCILTALLIMFSRITLGDHGYNQVIIGFLISATFISYFDYPTFLYLLERYRKKLMVIMMSLNAITTVFLVVICYINHEYRENLDFWKFLYKNKECPESFVPGAAISSPLVSWYFFTMVSLPFLSVPFEAKERKLSILNESFIRWSIYILLPVPSLAFWGVVGLVYSESTDIMVRSYWTIFISSVCASYLGIATGRLSKMIMRYFGVDRKEDYIQIEDIRREIQRVNAEKHNEAVGVALRDGTDEEKDEES